MDEKVGRNPNHKCVCKDTHPGMGPHRDCKKRGFHLCGCGNRASLELPDVWNLTATALLEMEKEAKEFHKNRKNDLIDKYIEESFVGFIQELLKTVESPLDKCIRHINELPQQCAVSEHYHAHHFSRRGLMHMCLTKEGSNEEKCAELVAKVMIAAKVESMDLIHVGGGQPAFHSSHVEMDDTPLMGIHIDPIRRN